MPLSQHRLAFEIDDYSPLNHCNQQEKQFPLVQDQDRNQEWKWPFVSLIVENWYLCVCIICYEFSIFLKKEFSIPDYEQITNTIPAHDPSGAASRMSFGSCWPTQRIEISTSSERNSSALWNTTKALRWSSEECQDISCVSLKKKIC